MLVPGLGATRLMRMMDKWRAHEATLQRLAIMTAQHTPHLRQVTCPSLGIVGDATGTGVRMMQQAFRNLPHGRLEIIHDSFDPSNLCQTDMFNSHLSGFLNEIGW